MSRASKIFFGTSVVASVVTVWGVHFLQKRESDTMYQGVLKDDERLRLKALATPSLPPLNTPSAPVQQPAAVVDPDCMTCVLSPPPELVESQSKEKRAEERRERLAEYEAQKGLAATLEREQGLKEGRVV